MDTWSTGSRATTNRSAAAISPSILAATDATFPAARRAVSRSALWFGGAAPTRRPFIDRAVAADLVTTPGSRPGATRRRSQTPTATSGW